MTKVNKITFLIIVEDFIFTCIYCLVSKKAGYCLINRNCQQQLNIFEYIFYKYNLIIVILLMIITVKIVTKEDWCYFNVRSDCYVESKYRDRKINFKKMARK